MDFEYIIVQAGGKGTRLKHLTQNKPKCLVPVENKPMLFHLFDKFPNKKFIIIGDYKIDILKKYLNSFAKVPYILISAEGYNGTMSGIKESLRYVPEGKSFMLIWSDLILAEDLYFPEEIRQNYIGISKDFQCRWSYNNGKFEETPSFDNGVAGLFLFKDKAFLDKINMEGEFVRYLSENNFQFESFPLHGTREFGLLEEYEKLEVEKFRYFNNIIIKEDTIIKEGITEKGKRLAIDEKKWYKSVEDLAFKGVPKIYSYEPFEMERIDGKNIYEYNELNINEKKSILSTIVSVLEDLHGRGNIPVEYFSVYENYYKKTIERIKGLEELVPYANQKTIVINDRECRNIFYHIEEIRNRIMNWDIGEFSVIHGDCTFSNMMMRSGGSAVLIDPRGYFGSTRLYGDPDYDWAKLYYSLIGNYDQFNLRKFRLNIGANGVKIDIVSNGFEELEGYYFQLLGDKVDKNRIKFIHALIWLSLTTYAWEDYDSICGAFYNGLYYLEEVL
ncbi:MAG: NTP transferase domain-containing protein [Tissierellia bacterium]|nr:NTP transferase domain-containing protein [Tissierellia bacterium]